MSSEGEFMTLQGDGSEGDRLRGADYQSEDQVHQKTEGSVGQPPASNPGSDDPSGGMAAGSGGVSGSTYSASGVLQSTVESVMGYSSGGSKTEEQDAKGPGADPTSESGSTTAAAVGAGTATTAAAGTATAASTTDNTESKASTASSYDTQAIANSEPKDSDQKPTESEEFKEPITDDDKLEKKPEEVQEQNKPEMSEEKKKHVGKENPDSIPTAGGQKLGEAHAGESKIVPDGGNPRESQSEGSGVSSSEGQPDKQTKDNTAQNTGSAGDDSGEGKQSTMDKIKDKIGMSK